MAFTLEEAQDDANKQNAPQGIADAASQILDSVPEPQQHAIDQFQETSEAPPSAVEVDIDGVPFDEKIHTGSKLKSGKWRTRRATKSYVGGANETGGTASAPTDIPPTSHEVQSRAAGKVVANMIITACSSFSADFAPKTEPYDERLFLEAAWGDYFVATGTTQFSPGWALTFAMGSYLLPRLREQDTAEKVGKVKKWFTLRIARWKMKRELKKRGIQADVLIIDGAVRVVQHGARFNSRNDGKREDNASRGTREGIQE